MFFSEGRGALYALACYAPLPFLCLAERSLLSACGVCGGTVFFAQYSGKETIAFGAFGFVGEGFVVTVATDAGSRGLGDGDAWCFC